MKKKKILRRSAQKRRGHGEEKISDGKRLRSARVKFPLIVSKGRKVDVTNEQIYAIEERLAVESGLQALRKLGGLADVFGRTPAKKV